MSLTATDVRDCWDIIKPGLAAMKAELNSDWRLEDVYASCVNQQAFIYTDQERTENGFLIVQSQHIPFKTGRKLLLWIAFDPVENSAMQYQSELEQLAKSTGHTEIEIQTPHDGRLKKAQEFGYDLKWHVVSKTI